MASVFRLFKERKRGARQRSPSSPYFCSKEQRLSTRSSIPSHIGILGGGQVGTAVLRGLSEAGIAVTELIGRDPDKIAVLKEKYGVKRAVRPEEADPDLDLILIAVSDDAIDQVVERLPNVKGIIAHCSGSTPLSVLQKKGSGQGVFYPLQSFSWEETPSWNEVPVCIEGSDLRSERVLIDIAKSFAGTVERLGGEERKQLHLAAVFACNFSNHLYGIAKQLLERKDIPFELLRSLILHTARKAVENDPRSVQTGPAVRGDQETVHDHRSLLKNDPELEKLYKTLSERIMNEDHGKQEF